MVFERREGAHPIDELYLVDYVVKKKSGLITVFDAILTGSKAVRTYIVCMGI